MYVDSRRLDDGHAIDTDVCVIGGGAAGITLALELTGQKARVCLLESGGLDADPDTRELNAAINLGRPYAPKTTRLRYFGGTTNHWGGHCVPIRPLSFQSRPWMGDGAWPFTRDILDPFYRRAHRILGLGDFDYDTRRVSSQLKLALFPFDPARVESVVARRNAVRFGREYRRALEQAPNVTTYLYANVTSLNRHRDSNWVTDASVRTLSGRAFTVRAKYFVLAAGGIENARLLLLSNQVATAGLGNSSGLVGRYFMEHIWYPSGMILPADQRMALPAYHQAHRTTQPVDIVFQIALPEAVVQRLEIPDFRAELGVTRLDGFSDSVTSAEALLHGVRTLDLPDRVGHHLVTILKDPGPVARRLFADGPPLVYTLFNNVEQTPDPNSRIGLARERDALGLQKATVDWRLSSLDKLGIVKAQQLIAAEVGRSGFGRMRIDIPDREDLLLAQASGCAHHMGTTRMHDDPKRGVVDANCRMHDLRNMFVIGSSVFPSCGYSNPTLTIVALTIRLADRLKHLI